jgi:UDP-sulfoquinovose synthase
MGTAAGLAPASRLFAVEAAGDGPFRLGLNTGTVRGLKLDLRDLIDLAARTGYRSIEPWIDELQSVSAAGSGALRDLAERVRDAGASLGMDVVIDHVANPRREAERHYYNARNTKLLELGLQPRYLSQELIGTMLRAIERHREHVNRDVILQGVKWVPDAPGSREGSRGGTTSR